MTCGVTAKKERHFIQRIIIFTRRVVSCSYLVRLQWTFLCCLFRVSGHVACCETVGGCHLIRQSVLILSSNKDKREAPIRVHVQNPQRERKCSCAHYKRINGHAEQKKKTKQPATGWMQSRWSCDQSALDHCSSLACTSAWRGCAHVC